MNKLIVKSENQPSFWASNCSQEDVEDTAVVIVFSYRTNPLWDFTDDANCASRSSPGEEMNKLQVKHRHKPIWSSTEDTETYTVRMSFLSETICSSPKSGRFWTRAVRRVKK